VTPRAPLLFVTSPNGGLAHYVAHLLDPVSEWARPHVVTWGDDPVDDLLAARHPDVAPLLDPARASSIRDVAAFARMRGVQAVNVHVAVRAARYSGMLSALLDEFRRRSVRVILTLHDGTGAPDREAALPALRRVCARADAFIVGHEMERPRLAAALPLGSRPVVVAPHGPYTLFDRRRFDPRSARRALGLPEAGPVVLFFGSARPWKGLDVLLEAWPIVRRRVPDAILCVVSGMHYAPEWEGRLRSATTGGAGDGLQVRLGYAPSSSVEACFRAADVVALPYLWSSQSGVLNLARAFHRPVVVTHAFREAPEIDGVSGRVVPVGDASALAGALAELLGLSSLERVVLGLRGLRLAQELRGWDRGAAALHEASAGPRYRAAPTGAAGVAVAAGALSAPAARMPSSSQRKRPSSSSCASR